jgi:dihydropteroate synthase
MEMIAKDTFFYTTTTLNCRGQLVDLSSPGVMGILNLSPDSFYDGGRYSNEKEILNQVEKLLGEGSLMIDVGASSSRPGAIRISAQEESELLLPAVKSIVSEFPEALLSIDTCYSEVAASCVDLGAAIINDISGGAFDAKMIETVAALKVPYVLMHMQGEPETMQKNPTYNNIVQDVMDYMSAKIAQLKNHGVHDIIIDPGFGFGKTLKHNFELVNALSEFRMLGFPVLVGFSRKSMIGKVLGIPTDAALNGTTVLNTIALMKGVSILRVHDVQAAMEAIRLFSFSRKSIEKQFPSN